jgi:hypothetical protein
MPMGKYSIVPATEVAHRFLALVEQARAHIAELRETGRWKHYYTEDALLAHTRKLNGLRDTWAEIATRDVNLQFLQGQFLQGQFLQRQFLQREVRPLRSDTSSNESPLR